MSWFIYALASSLFLAIRSDMNRRYKLDGFRLSFWMCLFITLFMLPGIAVFGLPSVDMFFYAVALFSAVMIVIGMTIRLNLSAQHNGRVANMEGPAKAFTGFMLWLAIDDVSRERILSQPLVFLGVLLMMGLATFSICGIRKNDTSWRTFIMVTPLGVMVAVSEVMVKWVLEDYTGGDNMYAYIFYLLFLMFSTSTLISGTICFARRHPSRPMLPKNMLKAGFWVGLITAITIVLFYQALALSPNPGYVAAIGMLTPVWLLIFHKVRGIKDDASPFMGTLMVISAIGLVLITQ